MFGLQCDMFQWPDSCLTSLLALQENGESLVHYFTYVMSGSKNVKKGLTVAYSYLSSEQQEEQDN